MPREQASTPELKYIYLVDSAITLPFSELARGAASIPLPKSEKISHFKHLDWASAMAYAADLTESQNPNDVRLVYKCLDMIPERSWPYFYNVDTQARYLEMVKDIHIIEVQPVSLADKAKITRVYDYGQVNGELTFKPISFVPRPTFTKPDSTAELERNVKLYLFYRTGEERGNIAYLRQFGPFKGYSVTQKKHVAEKLLRAIDDPSVEFTEEELNMIKNGDLGKATKGFEQLLSQAYQFNLSFQ